MADKVQDNSADFAEINDEEIFGAFGEESNTTQVKEQTKTQDNSKSFVHVVSDRPKSDRNKDEVVINVPANSVKHVQNSKGDWYYQFSVAFGKDADGNTLWGRGSVRENIPVDKRVNGREKIMFNQNEKLNPETGKYQMEKTMYAYMPADMNISIRRPNVDEHGNKINIINKDGKEQWYTPENWKASELSDKLKADRDEFKQEKNSVIGNLDDTKAKTQKTKSAPKKESKAKATTKADPEI